jgi:hypothetical protein
MTTTPDSNLRPDQIAPQLFDLLRKFHQESCYPTALDWEINEAVNDLLFLMHSTNWNVTISAEDALL